MSKTVKSARKEILLIEDSPTDALLIKEMLLCEGHAQFELTWSDRLEAALKGCSGIPPGR